MLVTLGDPASRLGLLCRPEYGWSVSVCVLPRTPNDPVPVGDDVEVKQAKPKALKFTGPYLVKEDLSVGED